MNNLSSSISSFMKVDNKKKLSSSTTSTTEKSGTIEEKKAIKTPQPPKINLTALFVSVIFTLISIVIYCILSQMFLFITKVSASNMIVNYFMNSQEKTKEVNINISRIPKEIKSVFDRIGLSSFFGIEETIKSHHISFSVEDSNSFIKWFKGIIDYVDELFANGVEKQFDTTKHNFQEKNQIIDGIENYYRNFFSSSLRNSIYGVNGLMGLFNWNREIFPLQIFYYFGLIVILPIILLIVWCVNVFYFLFSLPKLWSKRSSVNNNTYKLEFDKSKLVNSWGIPFTLTNFFAIFNLIFLSFSVVSISTVFQFFSVLFIYLFSSGTITKDDYDEKAQPKKVNLFTYIGDFFKFKGQMFIFTFLFKFYFILNKLPSPTIYIIFFILIILIMLFATSFFDAYTHLTPLKKTEIIKETPSTTDTTPSIISSTPLTTNISTIN